MVSASLFAAPLALACALASTAVAPQVIPPPTHADSLRGALRSAARTGWDVNRYELRVRVAFPDSTITGTNHIVYTGRPSGGGMQIDLQEPLVLDSATGHETRLRVRRDGEAYYVAPPAAPARTDTASLTVYFHGKPSLAVMPPWRGGFLWAADSLGRPWLVSTSEGIGASVWWPLKDSGSDEPESASFAVTVPESLIAVGPGRLASTAPDGDHLVTWMWQVKEPINPSSINLTVGSYAHLRDEYRGRNGPLTLDYWPIDYHRNAAAQHFGQVKEVLRCFEDWFGPYPWYEDGYKLVEVPYPGLDHQTAIAYGNHYKNGYNGIDFSETGLGKDWDYVVVHETAHEWFGNSITAEDHADVWVHEAFATYAEALFVECRHGREAGEAYLAGLRKGVRGDRAIVPEYGVNGQGSGDVNPKGANMLSTIRRLVGDDRRWRAMLVGLNREFYHRVTNGAAVEAYMSRSLGLDLAHVFQQYLNTTMIPTLVYAWRGATLRYRWQDAVEGFDVPVVIRVGDEEHVVRPTNDWQDLPGSFPRGSRVMVDRSYYITIKAVTGLDRTR